MTRGWATAIIVVLMIFVAPWPWYLIAVGGLLPVSLILLMALGMLSNPVAAALLLFCAAAGVAAFWFIARHFANYSRSSRPWAVAGMGGLLAFVSLLPIYGGGENLMTPAGKFTDAWTAYRQEVSLVSERFADRTSRR